MIRRAVLTAIKRQRIPIMRLAEKADMSRSHLHAWLKGRTDIRLATAEKVMRALKIKVTR